MIERKVIEWLDGFLSVVWGVFLVLMIGVVGYVTGKNEQARVMTDRCSTTGMYLTEGYAISCRVLTNEGYAPMIEQQKGK